MRGPKTRKKKKPVPAVRGRTVAPRAALYARDDLAWSARMHVAILSVHVALPDGRSAWATAEFTAEAWQLPWKEFSQRYLRPVYTVLRNEAP